MRLTTKKIEEVIVSILGEEGLLLTKEMKDRENVSEFDFSSKLKKDIKIIRKMLYLLYNNNLVDFTRKKDKEKGWYIYYWTLLPERIRYLYLRNKREQLARLQEKLATEQKELFFACPSKCVRLNFDQGMEFEFHCPECGELVSHIDREEAIRPLQQKIDEIEAELKEFQEEKKVRRKEAKVRKKIVRKKVKAKTKKAKKKKRK
ncbi:hypothetical protein HYX14_03050 [Candidatus Woesearchaeota archaeon]|nr:hypothetical protein [Candidatus Woesearchaeota archaeon]